MTVIFSVDEMGVFFRKSDVVRCYKKGVAFVHVYTYNFDVMGFIRIINQLLTFSDKEKNPFCYFYFVIIQIIVTSALFIWIN